MINEELATLILFANIEPADNFWAYEIDQRGAEDVYQRIISGNYYLAKPEILKLKDSIIQTDVEKLQIEINNSGSCFITQASPDWPTCLADLVKPPIGLIIRGDRRVLTDLDKSIAIVGSREPTNYGLQLSYNLAKQSGSAGLVVISGGAYGIDRSAHLGALAASGKTISVLAGGVNRLYPADNRKLFNEITQSGLLISEVMPDVSSQPYRFLIRY